MKTMKNMVKRDDSKVLERMEYFNEVLVPKYEKQFNTSLEGVFFWDPFNITSYPEEVEAAIAELEKAIKDNRDILAEEDEDVDESLIISWKDVIY